MPLCASLGMNVLPKGWLLVYDNLSRRLKVKRSISKEIVTDLKESSVWESLSITTSSTIHIFILEINPKSS